MHFSLVSPFSLDQVAAVIYTIIIRLLLLILCELTDHL